MMHHLISVLLVVAAVVGKIRATQSTTTGYGVEIATFLSTDTQCSGLPTSVTAFRLGYCIPTESASGGYVKISADVSGILYSTPYTTNDCSDTPSGSDAVVAAVACVCTADSCTKRHYYSEKLPAINGGTSKVVSEYHGSSTCTSTATRIILQGVTNVIGGCNVNGCRTSINNGVLTASQTTCTVDPGVAGYYQIQDFSVRRIFFKLFSSIFIVRFSLCLRFYVHICGCVHT